MAALLVPFGMTRLGGARQTGLLVSALGVGFLLGAPLVRVLVDRMPVRYLLAGSLTATALGFHLLFHSSSGWTALPAGVVIGVFGSMTLVAPQTTLQRVLPNSVLGRVGAVFFTAEAGATLGASLLGPALAQAPSLSAVTAVAGVSCLVAVALCLPLIPRLPGTPQGVARIGGDPAAPPDTVSA